MSTMQRAIAALAQGCAKFRGSKLLIHSVAVQLARSIGPRSHAPEKPYANIPGN
jgi:hypothetical protein